LKKFTTYDGLLLYFRRSCGQLRFIVFQKVMWNIAFYCISEGHVEYYVLLYFTRSCGILRFTVFQKVIWNIYQFWTPFNIDKSIKWPNNHLRGEDFWKSLRRTTDGRRTPSDGKSSPGLWPLARWAKN
jgi:hypothetical protein